MNIKLAKKRAIYLLSPAFVIALFCVYMAISDLYPFGKLSISWCDMNQQVIPFMDDLKDILAGRESLFYNLANAGGMSFYGVFLFFLASPLSLLVAFVDKAEMMQFCNILVVLKLALCALCAHILLRNRAPNLHPALHMLFSAAYAFCGYGMLFYQNIIWLDVMAIFPLLILSLYRLFEKKRGGFFTLMLVLAVGVNFYLSYMLVLCAVLFGGLYMLLHKESRADKTGVLFCCSSLLALLLSAPVWLPAFLQYMASARTTGIFESLRSGAFLSYISTVLPVVLSSGCIACIFFVGKDLLKNRSMYMLLILFVLTIIPLFFEPVNKMWHTGNYMGFPARYGYMPPLFAILIAATHLDAHAASTAMDKLQNKEILRRLSRNNTRTSLIVFVCILAYVAASGAGAMILLNAHFDEATKYAHSLWGDDKSLLYAFIFFLIFAAGYVLAFVAYKKKKIAADFFALLLFVSIAIEGYANVSIYMASPAHEDTYYRYIVDLAGKIPGDGSFFRVKSKEKYFEVNMIGAAGYSSMSHYSSLTQESAMAFHKSLGYSSYWMELGANGGTLFTDALMQNRYVIKHANAYGAVYGNEMYSIVPAPYKFPGGIVTDRDLSRTAELDYMSRLNLQETIARELFGIENLFISYPPNETDKLYYTLSDEGRTWIQLTTYDEGTLRYEIDVTARQTLYFDCFDQISSRLREAINDSVSVTVNGYMQQTSYPWLYKNGLLELGSFENETVTVDVRVKRNLNVRSFGVFSIVESRLAAIETRGAALYAENGRITALCEANAGDHLLLPIYYDPGLSATVNGKPAEISRVFGVLCYVPLEAGRNVVSFSFVPQGLMPGLAISGFGLILCVVYMLMRKRVSWGVGGAARRDRRAGAPPRRAHRVKLQPEMAQKDMRRHIARAVRDCGFMRVHSAADDICFQVSST